MKRTKNIFFLVLTSLLIFGSCEQEEELTLNEPSHRVIFTSETDFENKIEVGNTLTFGDVSPGVVTRTWIFPEGVADILDADDDVRSESATVKVAFNQVGDFNVQLKQTFENPAFVGEQQRGTELDTTILVRVLSPVQASIQAFYINDDGSTGAPLSINDLAKNEVIASKTVRYTWNAEGEPEDFEWQFEGGDPSTVEGSQEQIDVKYKRQGNFDIRFLASRDRPLGRDTVEFNNFISVVPSTDPVILEQITDMNGDIALVFSREMDASSITIENFNVRIENNGNVLTPNIASVSIDPNEGNIILLKLAGETLYNDDLVNVSYTPGALRTLDGVFATSFTDEALTFNKVNILKEASDFDFSFENSSSDNWPYLWWGAPWDSYNLDISDTQAQDGTKSALVEFLPNGGMIIGHRDLNGDNITFPVEAEQTYELGLWVYVDDLGATDPGAIQPDIRFYWNPDTDWSVGGNPTFNTDFTTGQWTYSSIFVKFNQTGPTSFMIRGYNQENPQSLKVYIDNITLAAVELRP